MDMDLERWLNQLNGDVERAQAAHDKALVDYNKRPGPATTKAAHDTDKVLQDARRARDAVQRRLQEALR